MNTDIKPLTKRQKELLAMSARGKRTKEIAKELFISEATVRTTLASAKERLGAHTSMHTIVLAISREELGIDHNGVCFVAKE